MGNIQGLWSYWYFTGICDVDPAGNPKTSKARSLTAIFVIVAALDRNRLRCRVDSLVRSFATPRFFVNYDILSISV